LRGSVACRMLTRLTGSRGRCTALGGVPRRLTELPRQESLRLLGGVPFGRIVYTVRALPAIVPVRHLVDSGMSVTVTGVARRVVDAGETAHYEGLLAPFVDMPNVEVIRIYPEIVSGYELVSAT
jgi:hypothetical protein